MSEWLRGAVGGPIVASPMESRCGVLAPPELLNQARAARLIVASPVWKGQVRNEPDHRPPSARLASARPPPCRGRPEMMRSIIVCPGSLAYNDRGICCSMPSHRRPSAQVYGSRGCQVCRVWADDPA